MELVSLEKMVLTDGITAGGTKAGDNNRDSGRQQGILDQILPAPACTTNVSIIRKYSSSVWPSNGMLPY